MDATLGDDLPARDEQHLVGDRLDLVQHVCREHDHGTLRRALAHLVEDQRARGGVRAGEGLVEQQHVRVVHHGLGELGALAHSTAVPADAPFHGLLEPEGLEGGGGTLPCFLAPVAAQLGHRRDELEAREVVEHGVGFGAQPDVTQGRGVAEGLEAAHRSLAEVRLELPRHDAQERRLARAVRAEQPPDAGVEVQRQILQGRDLAVPLRDPDRADERGILIASLARLRGFLLCPRFARGAGLAPPSSGLQEGRSPDENSGTFGGAGALVELVACLLGVLLRCVAHVITSARRRR